MRTVLVLLLALGFVGAAVPGSRAQVAPATPDSSAATLDSTATAADSSAATLGTSAAATDSAEATPVVPPPVASQAPVPATTPPPAAVPAATIQSPQESRVYYGGTATFSFGSTTRIGFFPMLGYKLTPKLSAGVEVGYEHVSYDESDLSSDNYGGSVFARYRIGRNLYAHGEYQGVNYEIPTGLNSSTREWVPFVLLGGGLSKAISARTSVYLEVLVDVLQDDRSPYEDWDPVVNFGVGVGF